MSSFTVNMGAETAGQKTWEELYRENLAKNGIPYEAAPLKNGVIEVKDVSILDKLAAAGTATGMAVVQVGGKVFGSASDALEAVGKTAKTIPVVIFLLAAGVAGYLVLAGRKGVDLTKVIPARFLK